MVLALTGFYEIKAHVGREPGVSRRRSSRRFRRAGCPGATA
jgi:hypothetical protein